MAPRESICKDLSGDPKSAYFATRNMSNWHTHPVCPAGDHMKVTSAITFLKKIYLFLEREHVHKLGLMWVEGEGEKPKQTPS